MADSDSSDDEWHDELERMLRFEGGTALHIACLKGELCSVKLLLAEDSVDINARTHRGDLSTPIYIACEHGHVEIVKLLLAHDGIDVNPTIRYTGDTPLFTASRSGMHDVVKVLLADERVAKNINHARILNSSTALFVACEYGHAQTVETLLAADGIDVNKGDCAQTPLHMACDQLGGYPRNDKGEYAKIVELLVAADAIDLNCMNGPIHFDDDEDKCGPLHSVAGNGLVRMSQLLMVYGADANAVSTRHAQIPGTFQSTLVYRTPAELAAAKDFESLAAFLKSSAAWSQLRIAASCRFHKEATLMLRRGRMDPDASPVPEIVAAIEAAKAEPSALPWPDAPPICTATIKMVADATRGWHRTTHWLHHSRVQEAVFAVLGVADRLQKKDALLPLPAVQPQHAAGARDPQAEGEARAALSDRRALPLLPPEMWMCVMAFFQRSWWTVEQR